MSLTVKKLIEYKEAKQNLIIWKAKEMILRMEICDVLLESAPIGTTNDMLDGWEIKGVKKETISIDKDTIKDLYDDFDEDEMACIKFVPELINKEYKARMGIDVLNNLEECITIKPATPSLDITEPEDYFDE